MHCGEGVEFESEKDLAWVRQAIEQLERCLDRDKLKGNGACLVGIVKL
jgi:hypothetical protein